LGPNGLIKSVKKDEVYSLRETADFLQTLDNCIYRKHTAAETRDKITKNLETLVQSAKSLGEVI
jgi:hypothetical protein